MAVAPTRVRTLRPGTVSASNEGGIFYWMSRDQRVQDNWALLYARELAAEKGLPLCVVFCLVPTFLEATIRHYGFMLRGLEEVESDLGKLSVPFALLQGLPAQTLPAFLKEHKAAALVTDFSPLRVPKAWKEDVASKLPAGVPLYEVDAHNVVPVWVASDKQEVGARTLRTKITNRLPEWLVEIPPFAALGASFAKAPPSLAKATASPIDWPAVRAALEVDRSVAEIDWCVPGTAAAHVAVADFCTSRLKLFAEKRNDPNVHALSDLSPYIHFGQLGAQRMALAVKGHRSASNEGVKSFLEESIVRRELADNFCFYNASYDSLQGAAGWARTSLELHASDKREHVYSLDQLEGSQTHEDIWNAAQRQMVRTGKMHGFMRMYWAKKILEWSESPAEALRRAIYLNDRYSIDGRDPNGYVGCGWAIMGVHDMGWAERPIFGKIRFMNYAGCKRKFDIARYAAAWNDAPGAAAGGGSSSSSAAAAPASSSAGAKTKAKPKAGAPPAKKPRAK